MKLFSTLTPLLVAVGLATSVAHAQVEIVTNAGPQCVFFGESKKISVTFHNSSGQDFAGEIRTRIFQTSSATAVLLSDQPWRHLQIPAGETVLASAALDFPAVKVETKFLVQWLESTNRVIGRTEVLVYPPNLLAALKPLADGGALGVFDPQNQFKPLLKNLGIDFVNLENSDLENFSGRLAVFGPFESRAQMRDGLANQVKRLAQNGVAVVWLQPPPETRDKLLPTFYTVLEITNTVVVVQPQMVANLPENPQAQLNLIYFCQLALNPRPLFLPYLSSQP